MLGPLLAMLDHKVGNFMVKDVVLGLDLDFGQKSLMIKLLISKMAFNQERWAFVVS